jgi:hypothetical protein
MATIYSRHFFLTTAKRDSATATGKILPAWKEHLFLAKCGKRVNDYSRFSVRM